LKKTPKGFWAFKIRVGRKTKMGTFATTRLETAKKLLDQTREDLFRQQEGLEIKLTVGEAMDYWLESRGSSPKHLDRAYYAFDRVRPVLGQVQVRRLTPADIIAFKRTLLEPEDPDRRPLAPTTVNIVLRYLAVAINWAVKNRKIAENPLKQMPYESVPEDNRPFLVRDDLIPFLQKVDALGNEHQQVAVRAMLLMGLRESEALRLRWDGFTGDWQFYAPARAKNGKAQPIPVQDEVLRVVKAMPRESEWVLPGRAGSLHLKGYTRKVVAEAGAEIGRPGLTPHRLRASCATIHAAMGVNAFQIRDLLRHERIATSQKYVNKVPCNLQIVVKTTFDGITEMFTQVVPIVPQATTDGVNQNDTPTDMSGEPTR
jgi:integrase